MINLIISIVFIAVWVFAGINIIRVIYELYQHHRRWRVYKIKCTKLKKMEEFEKVLMGMVFKLEIVDEYPLGPHKMDLIKRVHMTDFNRRMTDLVSSRISLKYMRKTNYLLKEACKK